MAVKAVVESMQKGASWWAHSLQKYDVSKTKKLPAVRGKDLTENSFFYSSYEPGTKHEAADL